LKSIIGTRFSIVEPVFMLQNQQSIALMSEFLVIPRADHDALVARAYQARGYTRQEATEGAKLAAEAARHGIRTHHALKALHLDHLFGSAVGGCVPGAEIEVLPSRFPASERWNAHKKLGQSVAYRAIERGIELADQYGIAQIAVDNAFHYLWGGGYVMEAAERGYYAYTNCTSALAEVVPFGGKFPTLGTNPHSWGIPNNKAGGFPIVMDWATSTVAMGRVQALKREGKSLPPGAAVDAHGNATTDPDAVAALLPFGGHKGYGMCLLNEILAALIGGSLPTLRGRKLVAQGEKNTPVFYFQVIHPEAISGGDFACGRSQIDNLKAVLDDILGHGNEGAMLPGQIEAAARKQSDQAGGLLFTAAEVAEFNEIAADLGVPAWDVTKLTKLTKE
jgi:L-2-hydroxycarboxylate dehydrogenase (NAD+)